MLQLLVKDQVPPCVRALLGVPDLPCQTLLLTERRFYLFLPASRLCTRAAGAARGAIADGRSQFSFLVAAGSSRRVCPAQVALDLLRPVDRRVVPIRSRYLVKRAGAVASGATAHHVSHRRFAARAQRPALGYRTRAESRSSGGRSFNVAPRALLPVSPCADVLSLQRLLRLATRQPAPSINVVTRWIVRASIARVPARSLPVCTSAGIGLSMQPSLTYNEGFTSATPDGP